jgi:hypothetical protein
VILHVAWKSAVGWSGPVVLQNGQTVPTVILGSPDTVPSVSINVGGLPCQHLLQHCSVDQLLTGLDLAGDCRFSARAASYQRDFWENDAGQCLYAGFLEALGYTKNKVPFRRLAYYAPLQTLESAFINLQPANTLLGLQSFLLGSAGLLPSQRAIFYPAENEVQSLEAAWSSLRSWSGLSGRDWDLFKVRPGNYPVRRIAALSYCLWRYRQEGWLAAWLERVRKAPLRRGWRYLEAALMVAVEGYWASHFDFGPAGKVNNIVLLGRQRAGEIAVNVLLPFTFAWGQRNGDSALTARSLALYRDYRRLEINSIEWHMRRQLGLNSAQIISARQQQGLLHIYKTFCSQGKCTECLLSEI